MRNLRLNVNGQITSVELEMSEVEAMIFADMQTLSGRDTAALRITGQRDGSVDLFIEEEQSRDSEIDHVFETVGIVMVDDLIYG